MKLQPKDRRVERFLRRHRKAPAFQFDNVTDPRDPRGRRWSLRALLGAAMTGMLAGCRTLRDVEALTEEQSEVGNQERRVPDTTLYDLVGQLCVEEMRVPLRQEVRGLWRSKCLEPDGLPCGVVSIDGKGIGALDHDADGAAQKAHRSHDGSPYWLPRVLRAVLTSAPSRPCLDQKTVPAKTNEMGTVGDFFDELMATYGQGGLFEIVTVDAGMTARAHADRIQAAQKAYVMALKGPQPELLAEARRLLLPRTSAAPDAQTPWQRAKGKQVRRRLWRTVEIAGYHGWEHLQQAWLVRQETRDAENHVAVEDRYFLTSVRRGRLTLDQILLVVRGHWGIENDCFWSLDATQWGEDSRPWSTRGHAVEVLGILRVMAYNLLQLLRKRHLRVRRSDGRWGEPPAWRRIFDWVGQALRLPPENATVPDAA